VWLSVLLIKMSAYDPNRTSAEDRWRLTQQSAANVVALCDGHF